MRKHAVATLAIALAGAAAASCGYPTLAPLADAQHADGGSDTQADIKFPLGSGANALLWEAQINTLYYTDDTTDSLMMCNVDGSGALQLVASLPSTSGGVELGGMLALGSGAVAIADYGFGSAGTIFDVPSGGQSFAYGGLDPSRRRVALADDQNGHYYSVYETGVSLVTFEGSTATETEIAGESTGAGFEKLAGGVATATTVFVSDTRAIYKIDLTSGNLVSQLTSSGVVGAGLLYLLPDGDLLTGATGPQIYRIAEDGNPAVLNLSGTSFTTIYGIAYDDVRNRLFVVDYVNDGTPTYTLHIVPFNE